MLKWPTETRAKNTLWIQYVYIYTSFSMITIKKLNRISYNKIKLYNPNNHIYLG